MRRSRRSPKRAQPKAPDRSAELTIEHIADQGDGFGRDGDDPWFVPGTLPGDEVAVRAVGRRGQAYLGEVQRFVSRPKPPHPDRCSHNNDCGGCQVQHLGPDLESGWKKDRVLRLLSRALDRPPESLEAITEYVVDVDDRNRVRADLAARRTQSGIVLGFQGRGSNSIIDLQDCAVLHEKLFALLAPIRQLLASVLDVGQRGGAHLTLSDTGADLVLSVPNGLGLEGREHVQALVAEQNIARVSLDLGRGEVETVLHAKPVQLTLGDAVISLPAKCFLQASAQGAQILQSWVSEAVDDLLARRGLKRASVIELYSGIGTLGLPLASKGMKVHAFEQNNSAVAAAAAGARAASLPYIPTQRDLIEEPLTANEIPEGAIVLLDPPRAGASLQKTGLGDAPALGIVYVSCDPMSFSRDAEVLVTAGYRLLRLQLLNQFKYSSHVELVAVFDKENS